MPQKVGRAGRDWLHGITDGVLTERVPGVRAIADESLTVRQGVNRRGSQRRSADRHNKPLKSQWQRGHAVVPIHSLRTRHRYMAANEARVHGSGPVPYDARDIQAVLGAKLNGLSGCTARETSA